MDGNSGCAANEELLFIFPAISLMSSPSESIKEAAGELIVILQKTIEKPLIVLKNDIPIKEQFQSVSIPGKIMFRLLQQLWSQVSSFLLEPMVLFLLFMFKLITYLFNFSMLNNRKSKKEF